MNSTVKTLYSIPGKFFSKREVIVSCRCVRFGLCQALKHKSSIWVDDSAFIILCDEFPYIVVRVVASGTRAFVNHDDDDDDDDDTGVWWGSCNK